MEKFKTSSTVGASKKIDLTQALPIFFLCDPFHIDSVVLTSGNYSSECLESLNLTSSDSFPKVESMFVMQLQEKSFALLCAL